MNNMTPCKINSQVNKQNDNCEKDKCPKQNDTSSSSHLQQTNSTRQTYKLIIQMDKVRARPGPKSKKIELMLHATSKYKEVNRLNNIRKKDVKDFLVKNRNLMSSNSQSTTNSEQKNAMVIQNNSSNKTNVRCPFCQKTFNSVRTMNIHKKSHRICQYCGIQCETQSLYECHEKLHINSDPIFHYKCHLCSKPFDNNRNLKVHYKIVHLEEISIIEKEKQLTVDGFVSGKPLDRLEYQCDTCKICIVNEDSYRGHIVAHAIEKQMPNGDCTTPKLNIETNNDKVLKYSCKVCSKEFNTTDEVTAHTKIHTEVTEAERECNICKKKFESKKMLNDHLAHHLSRAHHCTICRKAFINRITLKIHMKTHKNIEIKK